MQGPISQHALRILTVQALYALEYNDEANLNSIIEMQEVETVKSLELVEKQVAQIKADLEKIDAVIQSALPEKWTVKRVPLVNLEILRLATYELMQKEVPDKVAIDEAVELAKDFSGDDDRKFINGILSEVLKNVQ